MTTSRPPQEPSVADLVDRLSEQTARLVRDELKLARAEYTEKAKQGGTAAGLFGAGAVLAWFGVGTLLATLILVLAVFLPAWVASPSDSKDTPKALESEFRLREILVAAALQGALYATVKALVDRGGARAFERTLGEWPGD